MNLCRVQPTVQIPSILCVWIELLADLIVASVHLCQSVSHDTDSAVLHKWGHMRSGWGWSFHMTTPYVDWLIGLLVCCISLQHFACVTYKMSWYFVLIINAIHTVRVWPTVFSEDNMAYRVYRTWYKFFTVFERVITQHPSVAKNIRCFQRRLFVCLFVCSFVCQRDNCWTSKLRMMKLGGRCIVQKSWLSSNLGVIGPGCTLPKVSHWATTFGKSVQAV